MLTMVPALGELSKAAMYQQQDNHAAKQVYCITVVTHAVCFIKQLQRRILPTAS
jgi:glycosyltransferase A (GT-A) superfamily protein (DUF2064 family)